MNTPANPNKHLSLLTRAYKKHECRTDRTSFEKQMKSFEKAALRKYHTAIQDMPQASISDWFYRLLANRIIPSLRGIGFDEDIGWAIFRTAASSWESMGPITDKIIWFHPALIEKMEVIRKSIQHNSMKHSQIPWPDLRRHSQDLVAIAKMSMDPKNLFLLLEDIFASWIVLPRAFDQLEEHHAQYLPGYIKYLDTETNSEFGKIVARVTTEFVGNYSLKFAHSIPHGNRKRLAYALFNGYAAMFWKNLRNPPEGLEDHLVFENFFRWAKRIADKSFSINNEIMRTIEDMEYMKNAIFPVYDAFCLARDGPSDPVRFLTTLRHGHPGIESVIKYFGTGGNLLKDKTDGRLPYVLLPKTLSELFREIKKRYPSEPRRVQQFILKFLLTLRSEYEPDRIKMAWTQGGLYEQTKFVVPRIQRMIHGLLLSIQSL